MQRTLSAAGRTGWTIALSLFVLAAVAVPPATAASDKPNIVFLLIDDMGWPDVACYGNNFNETPVIDQLCADGMKFTDFYAATPVCSSTRSTIQSGQYSARTCVTDFIPGHWRPFEQLIVPEIENELPADLKTPGDALKKAGYTTGYFGKWHLGNEQTMGPDVRGYDVTAKTLPKEFNASRVSKEQGPKRIDLLTDQTIWFIEQNKAGPFFVTLSHHAVHIPLEATPELIEKYENKPKPDDGRVNNAIYAAMTENLDTSIGRIMDKLDELGLRENTIVVFTSDNGGLRQIYTGIGEIVSSNAPLRQEKGTIYEGGIRVPMIVRWPGVVAPGSTCAEPTTTADLMSTFCEATGASVPDQPIDGTSLVPLLRDGSATLNREAIYFHYPHYHHSRPNGAIRKGDWKLVEFFDDGSLELYNLKDDIGETTNKAKQRPELGKQLQSMLADWRAEVGARMPTDNPKKDAARAHEWWNRRTGEPLDLEGMAERYKSRSGH